MNGPRIPWRIDACSFDLFDTLIGRTLIKPVDLFLEVERRLAEAGLAHAGFAASREAVEFDLRKAGDFQLEVSLDRILSGLTARLGQDEAWKTAALEFELAAERETLYPIPAGLAQLERSRRRGKRILFVSDTYFTRSFLEPILRQFGIVRNDDRLHLSVEGGQMKSTGALFGRVAAAENLKPARIFHLGDNEESDVNQAIRAGWRASLFRPTEPTRYETPAGGLESPSDRLNLSVLRGCQRRLRLASPPAEPDKEIIRETTLGVSAPIAIVFAAWCLRQAHERGLNRLYFFSRDGEILVQIARLINDRLELPVDLHYLYVSRQALLLPSAGEPLDEEMSWIMAPTAVCTPRIILRRVEIDPETIATQMADAGFGRKDWDVHLTDARRRDFQEWLLTPEIAGLILNRAGHAREKALAYLRSAGVISEDPSFAVVDIGWRGTLQWCLSRLLDADGQSAPVTGLYFGLRGTKRFKPNDVLLSCFSDAFDPTVVDALDSIVPLLELFLSATHGGVSGYESSNGVAVPTFRTVSNVNGLKWGLGAQQKAMVDLTRFLCLQSGFSFEPEPLIRACLHNLELFARCPSVAEAEVYGSYLDAEDQNESIFTPLARAYTLDELERVRDEGFRHHHNEWQHGAIALTRPELRRKVGIENTLDEKHPICGPGVRPLAGFGPVEGPTPQFHLPRFFWAYGPECSLEVDIDPNGPHMLDLDIKNYHAGQILEFVVEDSVLAEVDVPQNFGEIPLDPFKARIALPAKAGPHRLVVRARHWARDDRPLAVILTRIELSV